MVRLDTNNWYRLEGYIVPTTEYNYSTPITNLNGLDIWYTNVEVQLQNPSVGDFIHGVNYKTRKFSDFGFKTIEEINANFTSTVNTMLAEMIVNEGALTYVEPFVITESTVICFDDAYNDTLSRYVVILKDDYLTANITAITAQYDGPAVAVDEMFNQDYLTVTGHFDDGHTSKFMEDTYSVTRSDGVATSVINKIGSNVFTATVVYGENTWTASFVVPGVKRLVGIQAEYDGPSVALNKKPKRKNIIVIANYSDGSASTVTDWAYLNGDTITESNNGILTIYYQGFECTVEINHYDAYATQIKAFYNGPKVEVGQDFMMKYLTVKIYCQDATNTNSYWEELDQAYYTVDKQTISYEKDNIITVTYITNAGIALTTNFIVEGFLPEKEILYITAEYSGPPIRKGKTYNPEKVLCKAYWNNGNVSIIKDFTVTTTIIDKVGSNEITLNYKENSCTFVVTGIEPEDTTGTSYSPTEVNLLYPEATKINHRRRGPMESEKFDAYNKFVYNNITNLFDIYNALEKQYKQIYSNISSLQNTGTNTLNTCVIMDRRIESLNGRR
jgi:hypothetical protein